MFFLFFFLFSPSKFIATIFALFADQTNVRGHRSHKPRCRDRRQDPTVSVRRPRKTTSNYYCFSFINFFFFYFRLSTRRYFSKNPFYRYRRSYRISIGPYRVPSTTVGRYSAVSVSLQNVHFVFYIPIIINHLF